MSTTLNPTSGTDNIVPLGYPDYANVESLNVDGSAPENGWVRISTSNPNQDPAFVLSAYIDGTAVQVCGAQQQLDTWCPIKKGQIVSATNYTYTHFYYYKCC